MSLNEKICIFNFNCLDFQSACKPYPEQVISAIDFYMPIKAIECNDKLQETMRDALKLLEHDPISVDEFVEHLTALSRINNDLPQLEKDFTLVSKLFSIINDFNLNVDAENRAYFKSLGSTFHQLKVN
jgi:dynein heavy chain, axonemal